MNTEQIKKSAVDVEKLASIENIVNVLGGCSLTAGGSIENEVYKQFPLAMWLLNTPFSARVNAMVEEGLLNYHKQEIGGATEDVINVPGTIYTTNPTDTEGECCWQPVDIAKCEGQVPMKLVCLKDCEDIKDTLLYARHRIGKEIDGLNDKDTRVQELKDKIAKWSLAMFTARNIVLGMTTLESETLKPFHGLMQVMSSPVIAGFDASVVGLLNSFEMLGCRLATLTTGTENMVFAVHPLIYNTIARAVKKDLRGDYPQGWTKTDDGIVKYMGIGFILDKTVPYDIESGYGDVWLLDGDSVGAKMGTDLFVSDPFYIRDAYTFGETNCGGDCKYWYNVGAVFANNANRLAVISNIKITNNCQEGTKDLDAVVNPITPIPHA